MFYDRTSRSTRELLADFAATMRTLRERGSVQRIELSGATLDGQPCGREPHSGGLRTPTRPTRSQP